jgi:hypothetical protein
MPRQGFRYEADQHSGGNPHRPDRNAQGLSKEQSNGNQMYCMFVRLEAKARKENEVAQFLETGLALANQEATTPIWFALRIGSTTFAVFDAFSDEGAKIS